MAETFTIHGLDPRGVNVVLDAGGSGFMAISAKGTTIYPGDVLEITPATVDANRDRNGVSWLEYSDDEQVEHWGRRRFGRGEPPQEVLDLVVAQRRAAAIAERDSLVRQNPAIRRQTAAEQRIASLNAIIDGSDA